MVAFNPAAKASPTATSTKPTVNPSTKTKQPTVMEYTVKKGDSLASIAKTHKTNVDQLVGMNPHIKDPDVLRAGSVIQVPAPKTGEPPTQKPAANPADVPPRARRAAAPGVQQAARRGAADREAASRTRVLDRAAPKAPKASASQTGKGTTIKSSSTTVAKERRVGDNAAVAAVDGAAAKFGQVEGQNTPWSSKGSVDRDGARFKGGFAKELNSPVEVAKLDERLIRARVTRAAGTYRESSSVEATADRKDGLKLKGAYNNQLIAWGYKVVGEGRKLPLGFTAQGKSKVAAGTYVDVSTEAQVNVNAKGPSAYLKAQATGFGGARNISEGSISSPHGIWTASGHASIEGGGGASAGFEVGLREGRVVVGANLGAKLGGGLELGGRIEVDYPKLFRVVSDVAGQGAKHIQERWQHEPPARTARQGWFW
jgi:LysM repeat protein